MGSKTGGIAVIEILVYWLYRETKSYLFSMKIFFIA